MPFKWTPEAETKLLLAVIKQCDAKPSPEIFEKVASIIGGDTNANGCSQKFYKLKREAETILNQSLDSTGTAAATPATPSGKKSKKAPATLKTPATGTKGRKRKAADDNNDGDGDDAAKSDAEKVLPTPKKKARKTKAKSAERVDDSEVSDVAVHVRELSAAVEENSNAEENSEQNGEDEI